jgi:hypothetical protein
MEKNELTNPIIYVGAMLIIGVVFILLFKGCDSTPQPAVDRLQTINDSLYRAIEKNNEIANNLYARIDSITLLSDTIISRQEITNKYYQNEVYHILNSDDATANAQLRTNLKKSDSLFKTGFYNRTYDLRYSPVESQLQ